MNAQQEMMSAYQAAGHGTFSEGRGGASKAVLCPFHQEKTPSCVLYEDHFICYSCGQKGSAAHFLRLLRYGDLEDSEAYTLAYKDLDIGQDPRRIERAPLRRSLVERWSAEAHALKEREETLSPTEIEVLTLAQEYYNEYLINCTSALAFTYAEQRGLIDVAGNPMYGVGFCRGIGLMAHLGGAKQRYEAAIKLGLIGESKSGPYERFKGRLIIPDITHEGPVWFTGRAIPGLLPDEVAKKVKYLHVKAPKTLFGAYYARYEKKIVVVEGQMCVLALRKLGIPAVGLSGKSLAARHQDYFFGKEVLICLDAPQNETDHESLIHAGLDLEAKLRGYARSVEYIDLSETGCKDPSEYISRWGCFPL